MLRHSDLNGLYAITATPATADAERWDAVHTVDLSETERLVDALIADGANGLIFLGTTGEAATITRDEYESFVDCALATARKRVPVFVGTTQLGLHEVVYRTRFAQERGADGILLGLPMWQPCTLDTAVEYYRTISEAFPELAVMVYGNTRAFRFAFAPEFWSAVKVAAPTVIAAKFARPADLPGALEAAGDRIQFLPHESALMKFYDISPSTTRACWSTAASMGPEPALAVVRALQEGRIDDARAVAVDLAAAGKAMEELVTQPELFASYNIQVEKTRIAAAGYSNPGPIRPPYHVFPEKYAELGRENARRWVELRKKYAREKASA